MNGMDKRRRLPARAASWLLLLTVGLTAACQEETATDSSVTPEMEGLDSPIVFGMVAYLTANGVREGRIQADTAYTYADSAKVDLRDLTTVFFDENGNERATVTGETGEWDQETDRMVARGNVVLMVHTDGSRIESAEINYDPGVDRVWSDSATTRTLANGSVTRGSSFESDIAFENVEIRNPRGSVDIF